MGTRFMATVEAPIHQNIKQDPPPSACTAACPLHPPAAWTPHVAPLCVSPMCPPFMALSHVPLVFAAPLSYVRTPYVPACGAPHMRPFACPRMCPPYGLPL